MGNALSKIEKPSNEPIYPYKPGSYEKKKLKEKIKELKGKEIEIPIIIGGREIKTGILGECVTPHDFNHLLGRYHISGEKEVKMAVEAALEAREKWAEVSWEHRASIFRKVAELLSKEWRYTLNAACMLAQSKTVFQAEIDSACELIDFFRFNTYYMTEIYKEQPDSIGAVYNRVEYRPLEGFVFAVTPFNFASIAGNLPGAPAMMGNVVLWKPASSAVYTAYWIMRLFKEAGVPDGVINFIPGSGASIGELVLANPNLAGVHFTGSTATFQWMWKTIGENIKNYKTYPRIVGETGGKNFVVVHPSAKIQEVHTALIRGAFEYQGQKCSAASRAYIPESMWEDGLRKKLIETTKNLKMGSPEDFRNFLTAIIDYAAFKSIARYIDEAKKSPDAEIIVGGEYDDSKGYFIKPTIIKVEEPHYKTMEEEIFGPVLSVYVYKDNEYEETLRACNETSPYGLTGAIFAQNREAIIKAEKILAQAAGNFYINDKPTGAVVNQQPFGGSRASGTNDKAGSKWNLIRWVSPRAIKEVLNPPTDYRYPFMQEE
ncbi:MAG: L-glutamate gamma-semialdehyde dehydrogenase [candidate division WOR-3 bacterium]|nr:L-glutamate gamma-semialdehyde dehydrogenase [candidate division WOR-3 bacterium]